MANKSLESILDEERREVLALLETPAARRTRRSSSTTSGKEPKTPVRSMLDIDEDVTAFVTRHASIAGTNTGVTPAPQKLPSRSVLDSKTSPPTTPQLVRSMLDVGYKPAVIPPSRSAHASPTEVNHRAAMVNASHPRSLSDAATRPASFGPRAQSGGGAALESNYQFSGYLPSNPGGPLVPKRNTQAGKKSSLPSAMAEVVRNGGDLPGLSALLGGSKDRVRRNNSVGANGMSKSPRGRFSLRSSSPTLIQDPSKFTLDDGRAIDLDSAYSRLSDASLARSQGGSASLRQRERRRTSSGDALGLNGSSLGIDYREDAVVDSSDDESDPENIRGRKKTGRENDDLESPRLDLGKGKDSRSTKAPAAANDEGKEPDILFYRSLIASLGQGVLTKNEYKVRSMLDPEITITGPTGNRYPKHSSGGVHPNTSFDEGGSGFNTPVDSETEADITDIKRAQKLSMNVSHIVSTPATSRCVRTIYRGDFAKMQLEAADNQRRVRKYLVATDLSEEAAHALEWTVGTVLRDGDTLLAIYCVDEDIGIAPAETCVDDGQLREQAAAVASSAASKASFSISTPILGPTRITSPLATDRVGTPSPAGSRNKAEMERYRAVQQITDMLSKLLRKTKLQVKVVIEVIHCKNPKHLITEVIDYINPTLVILGSRGRSALKGVILGSFSNYLVTKSSVPVMVARKRLKKHTKYRRPPVRLTNNLVSPAVRSLAAAKID